MEEKGHALAALVVQVELAEAERRAVSRVALWLDAAVVQQTVMRDQAAVAVAQDVMRISVDQ